MLRGQLAASCSVGAFVANSSINMTQAEIQELLEESACFACYGASQADLIKIALLNRISGGGSGSGVPSGVILMWSGTVASIPSGWAFCDGNNGTPDLRNRFVVGGSTDDVGVVKSTVTGVLLQSGGSNTHTHTVNDPEHSHTLNFNPINVTEGGASGDIPENLASPTDSAATGITINGVVTVPPFFALAYIMKL